MGLGWKKVTSEKYALSAVFCTQTTLQYMGILTQESSSIYLVSPLQFWAVLPIYFISLDGFVL